MALDSNLTFVPRGITGQVFRVMVLVPEWPHWVVFINFHLVRMV